MATVIFSGATGFIAQHCVKLLLDKGYKVVGTVRSPEKGDILKANLNDNKFSYEIVKDIGEEGAFDEVVKNHPEAIYFVHSASPFHYQVTDIERELLYPAINGTNNALTSIYKYGPQITRVVVTSSMAAVTTPGIKETVTEETWNKLTWEQALENPGFGYVASKKFAEKAVWDFMSDKKPKFTVNCVNPTLVFGPQLFDSEVKDVLNTSSEVLNKIFCLQKTDKIPPRAGGFIDVRDVSKAHLFAMETDKSGLRLLCEESKFTGPYVNDLMKTTFPELKERLPESIPGSHQEALSKLPIVDNSKTRELLGKFISLDDSVNDSIAQILKMQ